MTGRPPGANRGGRRRPAWEVLDAARERRFTGVLTFGTDPVTDVYLDRGRVYLAECDGDPTIGLRLVAVGVLTLDQLDEGSVSVADEDHLGRVFELVPEVDRARVLAALESVTDETVVWLAVQTPDWVTARPYLRHPSGVDRWDSVPVIAPPSLPAPLPDADDPAAGLRGWTVPDDVRGDVRGDAAGGRGSGGPGASAREVHIDWFDDGEDRDHVGVDERGDQRGDEHRARRGDDRGDVAGADLVTVVADDGLEEFTVVWPSGETARPRPVPPPPGAVDDSPDPWLDHAGLAGVTGRRGGVAAPGTSPFDAPPGAVRAPAEGGRSPLVAPSALHPTAPPPTAPGAVASPGAVPPVGTASTTFGSGRSSSSVASTERADRPTFPPPPGGSTVGSPSASSSTPFPAPAVSEQMRLAIRRTIAAIEDGMRAGADASSRWSGLDPDTRTGAVRPSVPTSTPTSTTPSAPTSTPTPAPTSSAGSGTTIDRADDELWGSWIPSGDGEHDRASERREAVADDHHLAPGHDHGGGDDATAPAHRTDPDDHDPWADADVRYERRTGPRAGAPFHPTSPPVSGEFPETVTETYTAADIGSGDDEVRRGWLPSTGGPGPGDRSGAGGDDEGRRRALRRLIDGLRNR